LWMWPEEGEAKRSEVERLGKACPHPAPLTDPGQHKARSSVSSKVRTPTKSSRQCAVAKALSAPRAPAAGVRRTLRAAIPSLRPGTAHPRRPASTWAPAVLQTTQPELSQRSTSHKWPMEDHDQDDNSCLPSVQKKEMTIKTSKYQACHPSPINDRSTVSHLCSRQ